MVESYLESAEERASSSEAKVNTMEEELRVVTANFKSLEVSEEKVKKQTVIQSLNFNHAGFFKACRREEALSTQIHELTTKQNEVESSFK